MAACPDSEKCSFYQSVCTSAILRIKYATMYPYCNGGRHESCMRWWMTQAGKDVPADLLPDGGRDWFAPEAHRNSDCSGGRVLVVDDMPLFRKALVGLVQDACAQISSVVEAESAEQALEMLGEDTGDWTLVVTDYNMGGKTGYDLITLMRANPAHAQLPAIVFSSDGDEAKQAQCSVLPRVRWLSKKPDKEPFVAAWQELVVERKA